MLQLKFTCHIRYDNGKVFHKSKHDANLYFWFGIYSISECSTLYIYVEKCLLGRAYMHPYFQVILITWSTTCLNREVAQQIVHLVQFCCTRIHSGLN